MRGMRRSQPGERNELILYFQTCKYAPGSKQTDRLILLKEPVFVFICVSPAAQSANIVYLLEILQKDQGIQAVGGEGFLLFFSSSKICCFCCMKFIWVY